MSECDKTDVVDFTDYDPEPSSRAGLLAGLCGCGDPGASLRLIYALLQAMTRTGDDWSSESVENLLPKDVGAKWLILYHLDNVGLTDHGTNAVLSWLTPRGHQLLALLKSHPEVMAE